MVTDAESNEGGNAFTGKQDWYLPAVFLWYLLIDKESFYFFASRTAQRMKCIIWLWVPDGQREGK